MKTNIVLFLIALTTIVACTVNEEIPIDSDNLLIGNWMHAVYNSENNTVTYKRVGSLKEDKPGISFKEENIYTERTSGWCGTPPLTFFDIEGTFIIENNIIKVANNFYPGSFNWSIVSLTDENLVVKFELSDQEIEHQTLMGLFATIQSLSESVSCTNEADWNFVAYGSQACGGSQGYIGYSNTIDTEAFLEKIQVYTAHEDTYNKKWNIVSPCSILAQPTGVACDEGKPALIYN